MAGIGSSQSPVASLPDDLPNPPSWIRRTPEAIDRWASSPTRAWATWLVLYVVSAFGLTWLAPELERLVASLLWWIEDAVGLRAMNLAPVWWNSLIAFSVSWFVPILLRLNLVRGLLWLLALSLARSFVFASGVSFSPIGLLFVELAIGMAHVFILRGTRQPAYGALVATAISGSFCRLTLASESPLEFTNSLALLDQAIYAAILLYGTKKIEPKASERAELDPSNRSESLTSRDIHLPKDGLAERTVAAIDDWFQLRWRALLTWIALSAVSAIVVDDYRLTADGVIDALASWVSLLSGTSIGRQILAIWPLSYRLLALSWFVPIALRLPPGRGLLWLLSIQFFAVVVGLTLSGELAIAWLVGFIVLNSWAIKGYREPASIAIAATFALGFLTVLFATVAPQFHLWLAGNAIYAAVLIYGTRKVEKPVPIPTDPILV